MINTQSVVDNVKFELGSVFETEAHGNNAFVRYVNSAVRDVCLAKNFSFNKYKTTVTVTAGTTDYTIPYQIETFYFLKSDGTPVSVRNFEDYHSTVDKSNIVGIWDDVLISENAGTYTLLYRGFPTTVTSVSGTIAIPEHFYDAIVARSLYYGYMDEKDYPSASEKASIFKGLIESLATRNTNSYPIEDVVMGADHKF